MSTSVKHQSRVFSEQTNTFQNITHRKSQPHQALAYDMSEWYQRMALRPMWQIESK